LGRSHPLNNTLGFALILITGYFGAKIMRRIHFPAVTTYLLVGILIGPKILDFIPGRIISLSDLVSNFVLGIIAFALGANFSLKNIKESGRSVFWISALEACGAWIAVTTVMIIYAVLKHTPTHPSFVLGAAAAATAPAATVMIIREYRAKGPVTEMLLRVVAIDDAWCLILSAFGIMLASAIASGAVNLSIIANSIAHVLFSIVLGGLMGAGLHYFSRFIRNNEELLIVAHGFILLLVGSSIRLHLSPLLTCMTSGIVIANISRRSTFYFESLRKLDTALFLGFFILVGANLEISLIPQVGIVGVLYIISRVIGKFAGVALGARISRTDPRIGKYLGWGLVPQAGVALGVALSAKALYPVYGTMIFTTITATTVVYELIGPLATKYGLKKAGEIISA
jgi:Kef-type K+ transport system membrane component KefB